MTRNTERFNKTLSQAHNGTAIEATSDGQWASVWFKVNKSRVIRVDYVHNDPYQVELAHETIRRS